MTLTAFADSGKSLQGVQLEAHADVRDSKLYLEYKYSDKGALIPTWDGIVDNVTPTLVRRHEIWKYTCFEFFWKEPDSEAYHELNLNQAGEWNIYDFTKYREPQPPTESKKYFVESLKVGPGFLRAVVHGFFSKKFEKNWTAVLLDKDSQTYYFALRHSKTKPDFHDPMTLKP